MSTRLGCDIALQRELVDRGPPNLCTAATLRFRELLERVCLVLLSLLAPNRPHLATIEVAVACDTKRWANVACFSPPQKRGHEIGLALKLSGIATGNLESTPCMEKARSWQLPTLAIC